MAEPVQPDPLLKLCDVRKSYGTKVKTEVLHGIDVEVARGEFVAVVGPSGSGKSTLLNQIGLLDRPSSGSVWVKGRRADSLDDEELTQLRGKTLGFVFQFHHLINALTVRDNLSLPLWLKSGAVSPLGTLPRVKGILAAVGLADKEGAYPEELSGGQQQRVAIARALIHEPDLVLADEPTGNLDTKTADGVFELLRKFNREKGTTFVIVTHDPKMAERCDRQIIIEDGLVTR